MHSLDLIGSLSNPCHCYMQIILPVPMPRMADSLLHNLPSHPVNSDDYIASFSRGGRVLLTRY